MKRIILGLSILLMLVQNGFALTDAEYDRRIANESDMTWKQTYKCQKAVINHASTADVNICLKAIKLTQENMYVIKQGALLSEVYLNTGVIYRKQGDTLSAYKYYMKAAQHGSKAAQIYLNRLCKESPWACK